jgi:hypothetical protein
MRTLSTLLCFLLMLAPAQGQQAVRQSKPNFYVPYGVRDLPVAAIDEEYSSSDARCAEPATEPFAMPNAPIPRPYPMRGPRFRRYRAGYAPFPQPELSTTETLIILGLVALCAGEAISRQ